MSLMPVELSYHVQDICVISLHKIKQFEIPEHQIHNVTNQWEIICVLIIVTN